MYWYRVLVFLFLSGNAWAAGEFVVAGGLQSDSSEGIAASAFGDVAIADDTWLSGGVARSTVDTGVRGDLQTSYADIGVDHLFDPVGIRVGFAYWGDDSILDSRDARASVYLRGERASLSIDYEYRDFDFELPAFDFIARRSVSFDANGVGLAARVDLTDSVDLGVRGIAYDYSVDLRLDPGRDIVNFISATRLSLINTLVDYRAGIALGMDIGLQRLEFDLSRWEGAVAGARTNSYTLRFLAPLGNRSDIEFGLGYDDSDTYGEVTVLSIYLYFYGGT